MTRHYRLARQATAVRAPQIGLVYHKGLANESTEGDAGVQRAARLPRWEEWGNTRPIGASLGAGRDRALIGVTRTRDSWL